MKEIILVVVGFLLGAFVSSLVIVIGDMNGDRTLDIKDLSILAAVINEQG